MRLFFITSSPELARFAVEAGVDRIFVDLESLGKKERQGHLDTLISTHSLDDLRAVRQAVKADVMVRLNPMNANTRDEVDAACASGADILMLPMFRTVAEVETFAALTAKRARICLLAETKGALDCLHNCIQVEGVDEVHIGLNDLSIDLGLSFMFEPFATGLLDETTRCLRLAGIPFGIGGLARVGEGVLPAELVLGEHVRLGSTAAILSRTFHRQAMTATEIRHQMDFAAEIRRLRSSYEGHISGGQDALFANHQAVVQRIGNLCRATCQ